MATAEKAAEPKTPTSAPSTTTRARAAAGPTPIQPTHTSSTTTTPLNSLSNLINYGCAYGRLGFDAGVAGATPYSTTNGIWCTSATCTTATTSSIPARCYGTTTTTATTANRDANANEILIGVQSLRKRDGQSTPSIYRW